MTNLVNESTIQTWMGRNIEELSREELLEVVRHLGRRLEEEREDHARTRRMWKLCGESGE